MADGHSIDETIEYGLQRLFDDLIDLCDDGADHDQVSQALAKIDLPANYEVYADE